MKSTSARHNRSLGRRLAVGSLAVALISIVLLAAVTLLVTDADLTSAGQEQETSTTRVLLTMLRTAYEADAGWRSPSLIAVEQLAQTTGFGLEVSARGQRLLDVATSQTEGRSRSFPIVVAGRQVGIATVQFPASGLSLEEAKLRGTIGTAVAGASALAAVVALVSAVVAARHLVAPLRQLTGAARQLEAGDLRVRVGDLAAPGEIDDLARAFDAMATHLEKEAALRENVVADLAHELRTPLAVLQGEIEALTVGARDVSPAAIASLSEEVGRLSRLVEDLEVLSAAQAAVLSLRKEQVDLTAAMTALGARFRDRFQAAELHFTVVAAPGVFALVDPGRIDQLVANLLSNALKFTPPRGDVCLSVTRDQDADHVCISVTDTGIGIPLEEQAHVFDRFFRGAAVERVAGSGIGLAVAARLAEAHNARLSLSSALGEGTTVTLHLSLSHKSRS